VYMTIRRLDQYLVSWYNNKDFALCVAVSRAVSVTHAMIVDDDQSTTDVISQHSACIVS